MSPMSDNKDTLRSGLRVLGLEDGEAEIYVALLREPSTALQLSRATGISRTRVYRVIDSLEKRSLISRHTDDRGTFLVVTDPSNLGAVIASEEVRLKEQQKTLKQMMPLLDALRSNDANLFAVRTYEGYEGLRQMCWHELKAKGELLSFGAGTIEDIVPNHRWAEKHRELSVQAGYRVREIINSEVDDPTFTANGTYMQQYSCRAISPRILPMDNQFIIYNDTVALYHWRQEKKVGVEIISRTYADTMRNIFEHFWRLAEPRVSR